MIKLFKNFDLSRLAIFLVYFWFGILKVLDLSPATPIVHELFNVIASGTKQSLLFIDFNLFFILFGLGEVFLSLIILMPDKRVTKVACGLIILHIFTTAMPLILLPSMVWDDPFVPTLEGQYIIKNVLILALVWGIWRKGEAKY